MILGLSIISLLTMPLHGSSFCYNGIASTIREVYSLPCSFVKSFGRGHRVQVFPGRRRLNLQTGRSKLFQQDFSLVSTRPCQGKRDDTQDPLGGENITNTMDEQALERELQLAITEENYVEAAKIRDSLKNLHEDSKTSVLLANARFYDSFKTGDLAAMQKLWAKGDEACVIHPGANGISGHDDVMESWDFVWADYEFPLEIQLKDMRVHVKGDVGYVTCREFVKTEGSKWGVQFATNVFERIDGRWFICIHHASPIDL